MNPVEDIRIPFAFDCAKSSSIYVYGTKIL